MKRNQCELILAEARKWHNENMIDADVLEKLEARYAPFMASRTVSWRTVILLSLGALLVGLGIILLLATNWDDLSRPFRTVIAFAPLFICVCIWLFGILKNKDSRAFQEPLGIFWTLSIGIGIAIISQTYQISGTADNFVLTWAILSLPVIYATLGVAPIIGFFALLFSWVLICADRGTNSQLYWLMILLAFPAFRSIRHQSPAGPRLAFSIWPAALISVAALGFTLEKAMPGLWTVVYSGLFATLYLGGIMLEDREGSTWYAPMSTIGYCGQAVLLYLMSFIWPWEGIGRSYWRADRIDHIWQMFFDYTLTFVLPVAALLLLIFLCSKWHRRRKNSSRQTLLHLNQALWGISPLIVATMYIVSAYFDKPTPASLGITGFLILLSLLTLATGLMLQKLRTINAGVLILLAIIIGKFFSEEYSFTVRGIVFLICGILFFTANWIASRKLGKSK